MPPRARRRRSRFARHLPGRQSQAAGRHAASRVRGATQLVLTEGPALLAAKGADHITLSGLVLNGGKRPLGDERGLVQLESCRAVRIVECEILAAVAMASAASRSTAR